MESVQTRGALRLRIFFERTPRSFLTNAADLTSLRSLVVDPSRNEAHRAIRPPTHAALPPARSGCGLARPLRPVQKFGAPPADALASAPPRDRPLRARNRGVAPELEGSDSLDCSGADAGDQEPSERWQPFEFSRRAGRRTRTADGHPRPRSRRRRSLAAGAERRSGRLRSGSRQNDDADHGKPASIARVSQRAALRSALDAPAARQLLSPDRRQKVAIRSITSTSVAAGLSRSKIRRW